MRGSATIPVGVVPDLPDDAQVEVEFEYNPGSAPTIGGPPESCDPGEPPEIESVEASLDGATLKLTDEQDSAVTEWLYAHHEFDDDGFDDGPDPDDWRDQRMDDRLTGADHD